MHAFNPKTPMLGVSTMDAFPMRYRYDQDKALACLYGFISFNFSLFLFYCLLQTAYFFP